MMDGGLKKARRRFVSTSTSPFVPVSFARIPRKSLKNLGSISKSVEIMRREEKKKSTWKYSDDRVLSKLLIGRCDKC